MATPRLLSDNLVLEILSVLRQEPYVAQKTAFLATALLEEMQDVL